MRRSPLSSYIASHKKVPRIKDLWLSHIKYTFIGLKRHSKLQSHTLLIHQSRLPCTLVL